MISAGSSWRYNTSAWWSRAWSRGPSGRNSTADGARTSPDGRRRKAGGEDASDAVAPGRVEGPRPVFRVRIWRRRREHVQREGHDLVVLPEAAVRRTEGSVSRQLHGRAPGLPAVARADDHQLDRRARSAG